MGGASYPIITGSKHDSAPCQCELFRVLLLLTKSSWKDAKSTVLASITFFSLLIHSQRDKDAGNLNPSEEGSKITDDTVPVPFGSNHSESSIPGDSVRVVRASMSNGLKDDSFSEAKT